MSKIKILLSSLLFNIHYRFYLQKLDKKNKGIYIVKKEVIIFIFRWCDLYTENSKKFTKTIRTKKKTIRTNKFSKVTRYKIIVQNLIVSLYTSNEQLKNKAK